MGYKEIYARYRQQIQDGLLKPGERVPQFVRWRASCRSREKRWKPRMKFLLEKAIS